MAVLEGIRVIDLTMWAFVPSAGGVLAHWGADVIKVENPRNCDPMRTFGGSTEPDGANRNDSVMLAPTLDDAAKRGLHRWTSRRCTSTGATTQM